MYVNGISHKVMAFLDYHKNDSMTEEGAGYK
jgi:hypothetical protein